MNEVRSANYYDCFTLAGLAQDRDVKLFSNQNIGTAALTNLQVAGQLGIDELFIATRWYARHNFDGRTATGVTSAGLAAMFHAAMETVSVTLEVGSRPEWQLPVADLLLRRPREDGEARVRDPWPCVIGARQYISCRASSFSERLREVVEAAVPRELQTRWAFSGPCVWVHLEGIHVKHESFAVSVLAALARRYQTMKSTEDQIADWLLGQMDQTTDLADRSTISVIRDGILDGRYRK